MDKTIPFCKKDFSAYTEGESFFGSLPRVSTCVDGHCDMLFPQFDVITEEIFKKEIDSAINWLSSRPDDYFDDEDIKRDEQVELYKQCQSLSFAEAIKLLHETTKGKRFYYTTYDMYVSMHGFRILRVRSCCR